MLGIGKLGLGIGRRRMGSGGAQTIVIGIMGQSQPEHFLANNSTMTGTIAKPAGVPDDNVVMFLQTGVSDETASPQDPPYRLDVTQAAVTAGSVNPAVAAGAVWLKRVLPAKKFVLADLCVPGTGRDALWDDANTDRYWTDFAAMLAAVEADYGELDCLVENWQGNDHSAAKTMRIEAFPFYFGQRFGGGAFTLGTANPDAAFMTGNVDHCLWDIEAAQTDKGRGAFRRSKTGFGAVGWPTFGVGDAVNEQQSFTTNSTGAAISGYGATLAHPARQEVDLLLSDSRVSSFTVGQHFSCHIADMNGSTHPIKTHADGLVLHGWPFVQIMARLAGLPISTPVIVATEGPTDGSYLDVLMSLPNGGSLTTLAALESRTPPETLPPHWQDVIGFEISRGGSARPVYRNDAGVGYPDEFKGTVVVNSAAETHVTHGRVGRVRITPAQPFAFGNTVSFLNGDASAVLLDPRDVTAKLWTRFPLEHVPSWYFAGDTFPMPGVAVRPQVVNLPVSVSAPAFVARAANFDAASYFAQTSGISIPATANGLLSTWLRYSDAEAWNAVSGRVIFQLRVGTVAVLQLSSTSGGRLTLRLNNDTGTDTLAFFAATGSVPFVVGQYYHVMAAWNTTGATVYVNGASVGAMTFASLDFAGANFTQVGVGANAGGGAPWRGDIGHLYINAGATLDLSVQANREKFALAGVPVDLGSNGQMPTGAIPEFYFDGDGNAWGNLGSGGNFSKVGTFTASIPPPSY